MHDWFGLVSTLIFLYALRYTPILGEKFGENTEAGGF